MKKLMLGNEAFARGLYEAGCSFVSSYPGTPSTEVTEFAAKYPEIYAEWAPNEKVAMESAFGASLAGKRSFCGMKHVGLNVAADPLFTISYTGVNAGMVICVADDPGMHSSQNEQDSRHYAIAAKVPMLEPSDSAEALAFTKLAFELSEKFDTPVLMKMCTRIAHCQSVVELSERQQVPDKPYEKNLALGTQEHLLEDATKTAAYIADASAVLGATSYRLSMPIHRLYSASSTNGVIVNSANMAKLKEQVAALKAQGIDEILYVTDSFILPYGYADPDKNHNITVPDPQTDAQNYLAWLNVNSAAFGALAAAVPEIKYFEPFNEINLTGTRLERPGIGWNATEQEQASYKYTVNEKAGIMADLCWYISKEVKAVDRANQVTTPSMCVGSHISTLE